jgi:LPXTG-motif cell wall-anchored protein
VSAANDGAVDVATDETTESTIALETVDDSVTEITVSDDVQDLIAVSTSADSSFPILPALGLVILLIVAGVFFAANRRKK